MIGIVVFVMMYGVITPLSIAVLLYIGRYKLGRKCTWPELFRHIRLNRRMPRARKIK